MPGLSITLDYRIMDILGGERFNGTTSFGTPPVSPSTLGAVRFHNQFDQSVMIGVRFAFNTPMPAALLAPAPGPAAALSQTYLVSFDPNKATLTDRARGTVRDAAQASTVGRSTRIEVTGNAGPAGDTPIDQKLSERRAKAVAAVLIGEGVPRDAISIQTPSYTTPVVPADPGVAQPRDQRVAIVTQ
jgi:outer membrane protein OmpA-like peptidoglycan-associated protein